MNLLARPHRLWTLAALVTPTVLAAACGGNVVVDDPGTGASTTTTTGTSTTTLTTTTTTGPQTPDAGSSSQCNTDYDTVIGELESALGCTPTDNVMQCSGSALVHDACGCEYVANEAHPSLIATANGAWQECLMDGCCGPQASVGCSPCPPTPTVGHCDTFTSQCVSGSP